MKRVVNYDHRRIGYDLTEQQLASSIANAGRKRGWKSTQIAPGHIVSQIVHRNRMIAVDIRYTKKEYSVTYKDSRNLKYNGSKIHKTYNGWVKNLVNDITRSLKKAPYQNYQVAKNYQPANNRQAAFTELRKETQEPSINELDRLLGLATAKKVDRTKWLFVIGIEKYDYTENIVYAKRTAEMFAKVAKKVLGVPKYNSYVFLDKDATQAKIKTSLKKMLRRVKLGDTIYFYYNGHGIPIPSLQNEPFMLTSDSEPDYVQDEKFFSLQNFYTKLSESKASKVIAVVDSCFSGGADGKSVLKGVAATRLKAKSTTFDKSKMVVLSAGTGKQYSNGFDREKYRLFSYFIMKNIIEGKDNVKRLFRKTSVETYDTSLEEYGDLRAQEPTAIGNTNMNLY